MPKFKSRVLLPIDKDVGALTQSPSVGFTELGPNMTLENIADFIAENYDNADMAINHAIPSPLAYLESMKQNLRTEPEKRNEKLYNKWLGVMCMIALNGIYGFDIRVGTIDLNDNVLINKIYKDCLKNDEDYDINSLVVFYRGEKVSADGTVLVSGKPFAFAHREIGICPFKAIENDLLYDVDWYDELKQEWLDPIKELFERGTNDKTIPNTRLASALMDWFSKLNQFSKMMGDETRFNTIVINAVIEKIKNYFIKDSVKEQPLYFAPIKPDGYANPENINTALELQYVPVSIVQSIYCGFDIPTVFTKKLLTVHRDMFPSLSPFKLISIDADIRFIPPLLCDFVANTGNYKFDYSKMLFNSDETEEGGMITVRIPIVASLDDGTTVTINRRMRYSVSTSVWFLANCQYLSVWPSAKIDKSLWRKYYVGVFEGIEDYFECKWYGKPFNEDNIYKYTKNENSNRIDFRPAVSAEDEKEYEFFEVSSNLGNENKSWGVHTTSSFPDYITVLIDENEGNENVEYGVIPVIPKSVITPNLTDETYCIAIDFGTSNTHCAIGARQVGNTKDFPDTITTSDEMLPIELSNGVNKEKHQALVEKIATRYWVPREINPNEYFSSAGQLFTHTNITKNDTPLPMNMQRRNLPLIDGRIIDLSADVFEGIYTDEKKRHSLIEEHVYTSMKMMTKTGDAQYAPNYYAIRVFLVNVLMNTALYAIIKKRASIPLNIGFAYPDTMTGQHVRNAFSWAIESLNEFIGCEVFSRTDHATVISEALSVSKYYELQENGAVNTQGFITADIGGGTTDISVTKRDLNDKYSTNRGTLSFRFAGRVATIESIRDILGHASNDIRAPHNIYTIAEQIFENTRENKKLIATYADLSNQYTQANTAQSRSRLANTLTPIIEALIKSCGFKSMSGNINNDIMTLRSVLRAKAICIFYLLAKYFKGRTTFNELNSSQNPESLFEYAGLQNLVIYLAGNGARLIEMCGLNTPENLKVISEIVRKYAAVPAVVTIAIHIDNEMLKKEVSGGLIYHMRDVAKAAGEIEEKYTRTVDESDTEEQSKSKTAQPRISTPDVKEALDDTYDELLEIMRDVTFENTKQLLNLTPPPNKNSWTIYDALKRDESSIKGLYEGICASIDSKVSDEGFPECIRNEAFAVLMFNELISKKSKDLFAK